MNGSRINLLLAGVVAWIGVLPIVTTTYGSSIIMGGDHTTIGTIILVSPNPGDSAQTNGTALLNNLAAISADVNNPYLIKLGPGIYDIGTSSLQMKEYVDIEGSGENTTIIRGSNQDPVVKGASNAELRFLTVMSIGSGTYSVAIGNSNGASPKLTNVTVTATGSPYNNCGISNSESSSTMTNVTVKTLGPTSSVHNYAVYNQGGSPTMTNVNTALLGTVGYIIYNDSSSPIMTNVTATADSGGIGIHNWQSSPTMANVTVTISGGSGDQYGIYNDSSSPIMTNVTITISGGGISDYNYGFYNHYSSPTMTNVTATVSGNSTSICHGVYNDTSSPTMTNVTAFALGGYANYGVYNHGGAPVIRDTLAAATNGSATNAAIRNDNNSSVFLSNVTANASGGTYAFGLFNINTAGPVDVNHSTFSAHGGAGDTRGIRNDSTSTIKVGSSKISGTVAGNLLCIYCYDGNYGALNSSCQ
jgi:hypothetical protein